MCNICARCSKTMLVFWEILLSLSARRVWIEILDVCSGYDVIMSLSARRVWIEIIESALQTFSNSGHSPRGGCGLKC